MRLLPLVVVMTVGLSAQAKPDLSGRWVLDSQPTPLTGRIPVCNAACTLVQTGDTLRVDEGMHNKTFTLTGIPEAIIAKSPDVTAKITTTAKWDGTVLVVAELIESADLNRGKPFTTTARLAIAGDRLTIEGVRSTKDGAVDTFNAVYRHARRVSTVR